MARTRYDGTLTGGTAVLCVLLLGMTVGCGGSGSSSSPSSVSAAPSALEIIGSPVTQVQVGQAYSFTPTVQGSTGGAISFSIQNMPPWASFSIATGQLTGTPASANVGAYPNVVISVSNGTGSSSLAAFTITVTQGGTGMVTLSWAAPADNTDGTPVTNLAGYTIEYGTNATTLDQSVTVASPSTTTYTIQDLAAGTWYFAIAAYTMGGTQSAFSNVVSTTID